MAALGATPCVSRAVGLVESSDQLLIDGESAPAGPEEEVAPAEGTTIAVPVVCHCSDGHEIGPTKASLQRK